MTCGIRVVFTTRLLYAFLMQIILLKDVAKVGQKFDVVTVSEGYALNFLIPRGLAKAATATALKEIEMRKGKIEAEHKAHDEELQKEVLAVSGKTITLHVKANEQGHLFAALHESEIASAVYDQLGVCIPEGLVELPEPIKNTGSYEVTLEGGGKKGVVTVQVESTEKK